MVKLSLENFIKKNTDQYFLKTKEIIKKNTDVKVTYAVFMRRPVLFCPKIALEWFKKVEKTRKTKFMIKLCHKEGDWVGAGDPLIYISGYFSKLVDLETIYLQLIGPSCVAAYNAYIMCKESPNTRFLAMDARHCAGSSMHNMMAYGASVGSQKAIKENKAKGFIGTSCEATSHYFGRKKGLGTMPHAFIGFAKSTLEAAKLYYRSFPKEEMTVLVDYFGKEISDSLEVCNYFNKKAKAGKLSIRLDTHGGRYVEGLDIEKSYQILEKFCPNSIKTYRNEKEMKWLIGTGVSVSSVYYLRNILDENGWYNVKIVASSGFNPEKCLLFANTKAPVDVIGTGSYIPNNWEETYATADIIRYNGKSLVKKGREFLIK